MHGSIPEPWNHDLSQNQELDAQLIESPRCPITNYPLASPKIKQEKKLPNSFYKASIALKPKPDKLQRKNIYRPIFLMKKFAKMLKKILANQILPYIKGTFTIIK